MLGAIAGFVVGSIFGSRRTVVNNTVHQEHPETIARREAAMAMAIEGERAAAQERARLESIRRLRFSSGLREACQTLESVAGVQFSQADLRFYFDRGRLFDFVGTKPQCTWGPLETVANALLQNQDDPRDGVSSMSLMYAFSDRS